MATSKRPSLGKTFGIVALLTVISKVIGLLRDIVVAAAYGTTFLADSYNYAYLFTGNILILFGGLGGPFHSATVTTLTPRKDEADAGSLMAQVLFVTALVLGVGTIAMFILAPYIVHLVAFGYSHNQLDETRFFQETISQLRVMSPLIFIAGLIGVCYGILNVYHKVFWPSLSPAIASCTIILALILFPNKTSAMPLAIGTLIGAIGQLFVQLPGMSSCPLNYRLAFKAMEGLKNFISVLWPALFGTSIGQLIIYVDSFFCSGIGEGAWTAISNANRLVQLPLGVLITAMLVPVLPRFTEQATEKRIDALTAEFRRALSFLCFLAMPLSMILMVLPIPIIKLLFQRGAFTAGSTNLVAAALLFLVPSIVFYIGRDLITRVFYAFQDSKTPYYVAIAAIFLKALLDYLFVVAYPMGVAGISLATSLITVFNLACLALLLRKKIGRLGFAKLLLPIFIMLIASLLSAFIVHFAFIQLEKLFIAKGVFVLAVKIGVATLLGGLVYFALCSVLGLEEPKLVISRLFKGDSVRSNASNGDNR